MNRIRSVPSHLTHNADDGNGGQHRTGNTGAEQHAAGGEGSQTLFLHLHAKPLQELKQLLPGAVEGDETARLSDLHRPEDLDRQPRKHPLFKYLFCLTVVVRVHLTPLVFILFSGQVHSWR